MTPAPSRPVLRWHGGKIISGYRSPLYDARLADWDRVEVDARTDGGAERVEVLWINSSAAASLRAQGGLTRQLDMLEAAE